jgi:hypothetical protein
MNVSEFKKLKDNIDEVIEINFNDSPILVKKYLSCEEKQSLIDLVSIAYFNNYNNFTKDIYFKYGVIKYYTDIKLPQKKIESFDDEGNPTNVKLDDVSLIYDIIVSSGLWDIVCDVIDPPEIEGVGELEELEYFIDSEIREEKERRRLETEYENSFQSQVEKVIGKIPGLLEDTISAFNNFEPEKLAFITEALSMYGGDKVVKTKSKNKKVN